MKNKSLHEGKRDNFVGIVKRSNF